MVKKQVDYKKEVRLLRIENFLLAVLILGIIMNFIVVKENKGLMPVLTEAEFETNEHFSFQDKGEVSYWFLGDIIPIGKSISSLGDLLIKGSVGGYIAIIIYKFVIWFKENSIFPQKYL